MTYQDRFDNRSTRIISIRLRETDLEKKATFENRIAIDVHKRTGKELDRMASELVERSKKIPGNGTD